MRKQKRVTCVTAAALTGLLMVGASVAAEAEAGRVAPQAGIANAGAGAGDHARNQQIEEVLAAEAAKSQERFDAISQQLRSLDSDIEARVDRIVKLLATVKDSTDSKSRIRRAKEKAIEGLKNSIAFYVRERDSRNQALVAPDASIAVSKDALAKDADILNERVDKRIAQITTLAKSLTQHDEFNRYERYRNSDYDYNDETKEFKRHEKDAGSTAKTKAELVRDLKASIDKQTREIEGLRQMLKTVTDPKRQEQLKDEIEGKEEIIADRRQQAEELLTANAPNTKPISRQAAFEIDKMLAEMTLDLQGDFRKFQQLVAERNEAQKRTQFHQDRLQRFRGSLAPDAPGQAAATPVGN